MFPGSERHAVGGVRFSFEEEPRPFAQANANISIGCFPTVIRMQDLVAGETIGPEVYDFYLKVVFARYCRFGDIGAKRGLP